ncbi:MAG: peptidyl-prolyl cis-trans isomerase [Deltaproteobacteria bacterium]|jgi:parvulin-like peptidyl-prolyl isomerase|nr:peptidyl-prolyl cis-trans isomerase [Deltaproteobacteria bacterium]
MAWKRTAIIAIALGLLACSKQPDEAAPEAKQPKHALSEEQANAVLVKVGDRTITVGELADRLASQSPYLQARFESPERRKELLDNLVRYELLVYEAKRRGYADDPEVVSARRNVMIQELIKQEVDAPLEGREVTDEEVQAAYDANPTEFDRPAQVRASHIFIKSRAKAARVLEKAKGSDRTAFTKLAREESEDDATKADGGDLRFFTVDAEKPSQAVRRAAFSVDQVGTVYPDLIPGDGGYHIVMLTGKRAELKRTYEQAKRAIRHKLSRERKEAAMEALTERLRKEVKVEVDYDALAQVRVDLSDQPAAK